MRRKLGVDPSITGPTQGPTTHRARTWPGQHFDPKREAMTRYHPNISREQPRQVSWRSEVVWLGFEKSRQNGRSGPEGPRAQIQITLSQARHLIVPRAHAKFGVVPTLFDAAMVEAHGRAVPTEARSML